MNNAVLSENIEKYVQLYTMFTCMDTNVEYSNEDNSEMSEQIFCGIFALVTSNWLSYQIQATVYHNMWMWFHHCIFTLQDEKLTYCTQP